MVPFIVWKVGEARLITVCNRKLFHRVSVYESGTIDVNKISTSLFTIIERWNVTCLNQQLSGQVRVLYFCKILLIRIIYRFAMATTSVQVHQPD